MGIFLIPSYLPRVTNLSVGALSRGQESKEWFLNPQVVNRIFGKMGRAQVDLFASRESAHLPVYFSIDRKDRRVAEINALIQRWQFKKKYASPPPQLIPLILAKIRDFGGSHSDNSFLDKGRLGCQNSSSCPYSHLYCFQIVQTRQCI